MYVNKRFTHLFIYALFTIEPYFLGHIEREQKSEVKEFIYIYWLIFRSSIVDFACYVGMPNRTRDEIETK